MINTLHDLYIHQIKDLRSANKQITDALPGMIERVEDRDLRKSLNQFLNEAHGQFGRIDEILKRHGLPLKSEHCEATAGLIAEGEKLLMKTIGKATDAGVIATSQRIKHYEIAAYGTAEQYAHQLEYPEDAKTLKKSLKEVSKADSSLSDLATGGWFTSGVNEDARVTADS